MSKVMLYAYAFYNWLTRGELINPQSISEVGLVPYYSRIVTKRSVQKVWLVTSLPVIFETSEGHEINLANLILGETKKHYPKVTVNFNISCDPININTTDRRFVSEFQKANEMYDRYKDVFDNMLTESEKLTGKVVKGPNGVRRSINKKRLANIRDRYESYKYTAEHIGNQGTMCLANFFIHAHAPDTKVLKDYEDFLIKLLNRLEVYNADLHGDLDSYLESYCPAGYKKLESKKFKQMLLSNENLASLLPYDTKGLVGGKGIPIAIDIDSKLPMIIDFFNSGQGQVIGAYGQTGSGKTFLLQHITIALLAESVHVSALDLKGLEWSKLFPICPGLLIAMEGQGSRFVNTLRIDDMPVHGLTKREVCEIYDMAYDGTVQLLQVMCNLKRDSDIDVDSYNLLSNAVKKVFNQAGVIRENGNTFYRTRDLRYEDVLDMLIQMLRSSTFRKYEDLINIMINRLSMFLSQDGNYSHIFENELTLREIIDHPFVVYSLNKNAENATSIIDTLRIFMIQYLDSKKQYLRKLQGKHTVVFYEELQRCNQFGRLLKFIASTVTGSRSNNVKVFLLFNSLSALDDRDASDIRSNISSWFIGKVGTHDKNRFINEYGMQDYVEYLNQVENGRIDEIQEFDGTWETGEYKTFFANVNTGVHSERALIRVKTPTEFKELLKTVDGKN